MSLKLKTAIVTGATGAIGKAIALQMAQKKYRVIMVCRNPQKAESAQKEIIQKSGNPEVLVRLCDLARLSEIQELSTEITEPIDVLINNAAVTPRNREETPEGLEVQFATNVLSYFWMSLAFYKNLVRASQEAGSARIVNVASFWAGDLDLNDLQFSKRRYSNSTAYRQSKQANRMLTVAFAQKYAKNNILVNSCHPGEVSSALSNSMGFGGHDSPERGAQTPVWLATSGEVAVKTGRWFAHLREEPCSFSQDKIAIGKLYEICRSFSAGLE